MEISEQRKIIYEYVFGYDDYEIIDAPYWMDEMVQKIEQAFDRLPRPTKDKEK